MEIRFRLEGIQLSSACIYKFSKGLSIQKAKTIYSPKFHDSFDIMMNNQPIGNLFSRPIRNPFYLKNDIVILRILNWYLYQKKIAALIKHLTSDFLTVYKAQFEFHSYERLDIAYDTEVDIVSRFKYMYNRKSRFTFIHEKQYRVRGLGRSETETTIGSIKKRRRMVMIYDKTHEPEMPYKPYLRKLYSKVFRTSTVYRCEIRLFNSEANRFQIDPMMLDDPEYLLSIFSLVIDQMIDFRSNNQKNVTRQKKIAFLSVQPKHQIIAKVKTIHNQNTSNAVKFLVKTLYGESVGRLSANGQLLKFVAELFIKLYNLDEWCNAKNIRK
ncbi:MAG: hypothetical protein ACOYNC_16235 [Bacteroidales bacterium]